MSQGFYKHHLKQHIDNKEKSKHSKLAKMLDSLMYIIALIAPIMTIPQLIQVWVNKETGGISLLTWGSYAFVSGLWLVYGISHKEKPIILTQLLLLILDTLIVVGVILHI